MCALLWVPEVRPSIGDIPEKTGDGINTAKRKCEVLDKCDWAVTSQREGDQEGRRDEEEWCDARSEGREIFIRVGRYQNLEFL